ncbi:MAG: response regulator [Clostridium sp.]|nr:response regulator [Clostridium sp.]MCM1208004.1 response regulator [Ruminococcus sp.]
MKNVDNNGVLADVSEEKKLSVLNKEIDASKIILEEITRLTAEKDFDLAMNNMLANIGSYLKVGRMYIFEEYDDHYAKTYEWREEGLGVKRDEFGSLSSKIIVQWLEELGSGNCIHVDDVENIKNSQQEVYELLVKRNVRNIILAPIMSENKMIGFLGADNAPDEFTKLIIDCLAALGSFIGVRKNVFVERKEIEKQNFRLSQEKKRYRDALSSNCEYCYSFDLTEGIIYDRFRSGHGIDIITELELNLPVSFDVLNKIYIAKYKIKILNRENADVFSCEGLREQYEQGKTNVVTEYYSSVTDRYSRVSALLSEDELTGHIYAVIIAEDITEDKKREESRVKEILQAKEELTALNEELQATLESELEKIAIISAIGNIYFCNILIDLETGTIAETIDVGNFGNYFYLGRSITEAFAEVAETEIEADFRKELLKFTDISTLCDRLQNNRVVNFDCLSVRKRWVRISFIAVRRYDDGRTYQALVTAQYIDEQKQREFVQQEALMAAYESATKANLAKTNFLANMSHDIRTPMNAIIGMTAIAATNIDNKERVADCLAKITVSSKHLLGLINEVLDMSKIESGKLSLNDDAFSIPDVVDHLLTMMKPQIDAKGHELKVTIKGISHERVIGDSQRLEQVFTNLMSNAVKYTPDGGKIELIISEKPINKPNLGCYEFVFSDNGIGMDEEFQKHFFEPFTRAEDSRINKIQGTGLGMAITKNVVEMMNGSIKLESRVDEGTRITVTVILKLQDDNENFSYKEFIDLPILVADDDDIACEMACMVLSELGMKGEWVLSGKEAVEQVVQRHENDDDYFAVILDWKMPDMDGIETTRQIRKRVGKDVPIIIISTYDWSDIELEARAAGANAFISKPLFKSRMAYVFSTLMKCEMREEDKKTLESIIRNDFSGKRALLVEDNELNTEIAMEILKMAGLEVDHAKNGKEALDIMTAIEDDYYDIIFMDIQMPVMNGYDAARAIRSLPREYTMRVPIVAMTANAFNEDIQAAKNAGMNQHVSKPINFQQLMDTLNKWV